MTELSVWAPHARERVDAHVEGRRVPMRPADRRGWWSAEVDAGAGTDYAFALDGGEPLPDPRSRWQPAGVHGPSRLYDDAAFAWSDQAWQGIAGLHDQVIYELHIGTFSPEGTFAGAVDRLDHLADLGVTVVSVLPVAQFSGTRGWGYDGVDLYAVHDPYGGPDGFKAFVDACHGRGLAVVLDVVYNHLGPEGNHLGRFGPYFTDFYATPWGAAVNYDQAGSDEVRRFVIDNALMWLRDYHVDGLRLDAVHAIVDTSAVHVLEQLATEVDALEAELGTPKLLIAESDLNDPRLLWGRERGGYGLDAQWSDDFHHALHSVITGERNGYYEDFGELAHLATALERTFVYAGRYSRHRDRTHGRAPTGLGGERFLGYSQNHDQVGNRATGDRLGHAVTTERLKVAAALVLTGPFVPMLFQGEEWAASSPFQYFTSHEDPELGRAVSQGRRSEFASFDWDAEQVPDPQDPATFERSRLDWGELGVEPHASVLGWYRRLLELRAKTPDLQAGAAPTVTFDEAARWLVVRRRTVAIVANLAGRAQDVPLDDPPPRVLLASTAGVALGGGAVSLPPDSVAVLG